MSLVPRDYEGNILFFRSKVEPWTTSATAIGTTSAAVTAMSAKVDSAQALLEAQTVARAAAKNATAALLAGLRDLNDAGGDIIKQIRAKAAIDGQGVYLLAEIPAPATPSPVPPPGKPTDFIATLTEGGSLKLQWKCANPKGSQGTIYQISRRIGEAAAFVTLGVSGYKRFTDSTVPSGVASVTYKIIAIRSTAYGDEGLFTVNFGVSGQAMTASVAPRIAA